MNRTKTALVLCSLWLALLWPADRLLAYRDLETGTFLTRDPAGMVDGPNLYSYVRQNPWTKFDPEGLSEAWPWGSWVDYTVVGTALHVGFDIGETGKSACGGVRELMNASDRGMAARSQMEHSDFTTEQYEAFTKQQHEGIDHVGHGVAAVLPVVPGTSMTGPAALPEASGAVSLESTAARDSAGSIENSALKTKALADKEVSAVSDVGTANDLRKTAVPGTEVHHAPGSATASTLVGDHNPANGVGNEPAMRLPRSEHEAVTAAQNALPAQASARDLLANEARILRNNTNAPNSKIQELIQLNKDKHPYDYNKLNQ